MTQFELTADSAGVTALVSCTETVDENTNSSTFTVTVQLKSRMWYGVSYFLEGTVGDTVLDSATDYAYLGALNQYYPVERSFYITVPHQADGTGTAVITLNIKGKTRSGGAGSGWRIQGSHSIPMTNIARASTVGATDAEVGAVAMIAVSRKNSGYCHTLGYGFGSLSGFISPDGTTSAQPVYCTETAIAFRLPEDFYYQLTDSNTGVCTITCTTYDGTTPVGVPTQCGFTVTAPYSKCAPLLSAQVVDVNPETLVLTGDENTLVRFISQPSCTVSAQARYGATILEQSADGVMAPTESGSFTFYALDSRGYRSELTVHVPMIPYVLLSANVSCRRTGNTENTAVFTVQGSFYNGSFGQSDNTLTVTVRTGQGDHVLEPVVEGNSYRVEGILEDLDYTQSHLIQVTVRDLISSVTEQTVLQQGIPVFDWGKRDFAFHVPITAPMINGVTNPAFKAWPVGSVIPVADGRSPADTIGGKWEKLQDIGLDLDLWRRLKSVDLLGSGILGSFVLGQEA